MELLILSVTSQECEVNAQFIARTINVPERRKQHAGVTAASRAEVVADLERVQGGHPVLRRTMAKGVAFHNAGESQVLVDLRDAASDDMCYMQVCSEALSC